MTTLILVVPLPKISRFKSKIIDFIRLLHRKVIDPIVPGLDALAQMKRELALSPGFTVEIDLLY